LGLDIKNVSITLSGNQIVKDISVRIQDGQFVGLLGPNGCGKSTLLRSIYKAIKPDSGEEILNELDILRVSSKELAKRLSVVSQFNELSFDFSVRQLVLMGRTPHKKLLERDNIDDINIANKAIAAVGLEGFEDRSYGTLSGGEKQRVVLARAIAQQPIFMCLDEPTNHLDIKYQLKLMTTVKTLHIGILAAMHDLTLASIFCSYIYLMKAGKIVTTGTPNEVLTRENIRDVYEVDCLVLPHPVTGHLTITYIV
jgi:iron complex transport system ATP-binding protein